MHVLLMCVYACIHQAVKMIELEVFLGPIWQTCENCPRPDRPRAFIINLSSDPQQHCQLSGPLGYYTVQPGLSEPWDKLSHFRPVPGVTSCEWTQDPSWVGSEPRVFKLSGFSKDLYSELFLPMLNEIQDLVGMCDYFSKSKGSKCTTLTIQEFKFFK